MSDPEKRRGCGCGCLGKGCITMVVVGALLIGVLVWGGKSFTDALRSHASKSALQLPPETGTKDEYDALMKRLDDFKSAPPGSKAPLNLTAHDLNLLIEFSPEWEMVRGKIHADIEKDNIELTGSLPLGFVDSLDGFLNGVATFSVSMEDKVMHVSVRSIKVVGKELTTAEQKQFSSYWASYLTTNMLPVIGPVLLKAKTVKTQDGVIVITPG